jgi:hypothetical protein
MDWIRKRYTLREDQQGRLVYFPFGLMGYGYEVTNRNQLAWLQRQERLRGIGFVVVFFAASMIQVALESRAARMAVFLLMVLCFLIATGVYLVYRTPSLRRLRRQPGAIEREAEAAGVSIGRAFVRLQATTAVMVLIGFFVVFWLKVYWIGALVVLYAVYFGIRATRDYTQSLRLRAGGTPPPSAPN